MSFEEEKEKIHIQMMSSVSHDLKTPLASVIGSLEIYQKMKSTLSVEKQEMLLQTALQEAYRLDRFVSNILDMAKLENGMVRMHVDRCDLGQVVGQVVQKCRDKYPAATLQMDDNIKGIDVVTDASLLNRALLCVVENAIIHGTSMPMVRITADQTSDAIIIGVADNGPGVPANDRQKIFDKYTRVIQKDHKNAGTGLGLAIARKIMQMMHGDIRLVDHDGEGSRFEVILPAQP